MVSYMHIHYAHSLIVSPINTSCDLNRRVVYNYIKVLLVRILNSFNTETWIWSPISWLLAYNNSEAA